MATPRCFKSAINRNRRSTASSKSELVGSSISKIRALEASARTEKAIAGADNRGAASTAEIVFLTVPYAVQRATVEEVLGSLGLPPSD